MSVSLIDRRRLSDSVVEQITSLIKQGTYRVGDRLPSERELAQSLGVSRTLVREGLRILEALGLINVRPGVGAIVTRSSSPSVSTAQYLWEHPSETTDVLEIREMLAHKTGQLAVKHITNAEVESLQSLYDAQCQAVLTNGREDLIRLDRRFHAILYGATRNRMLVAIAEYSRTVLDNIEFGEITFAIRPTRSLAEHRRIIDALVARDAKATAKALELHTRRTNEQIRKLLERRAVKNSESIERGDGTWLASDRRQADGTCLEQQAP